MRILAIVENEEEVYDVLGLGLSVLAQDGADVGVL